MSSAVNTSVSSVDTVYIIDGDESIQESLRALLGTGARRIRAFSCGEDFLNHYESDDIAVVLLETHLPGLSGLEVQDQLIARGVDFPIVFVTNHANISTAVSAMKKGAVDFLQKPIEPQALQNLIARQLELARQWRGESDCKARRLLCLSKLTKRELEVLKCIVNGQLNKQIADELEISVKTVEAHRSSIMSKTNSRTVADLLRFVLS